MNQTRSQILEDRHRGSPSVVTDEGTPWGSQPYFCFETRCQQCIHANRQDSAHWSPVFDDDTFRLGQLEWIGVDTNYRYANTSVATSTSGSVSLEQVSATLLTFRTAKY